MSIPSGTRAALAALLCTASAAAAQSVRGPTAPPITPGSTLAFLGTADATDIGLAGVRLDFMPRVVVAAAGNTGSFAALTQRDGAGLPGDITALNVGNGPASVRDFLTVGGYRFTLTSLPSGPYGQDACYVEPVPAQTCTPYQSVQGDPTVNAGLSPFYVENVASSDPDAPITSTAAFHVIGTVTGLDGATSDFFGTISATFVGVPYQEVLYTLEQQGLQGLLFAGTFTATMAGAPAAVVPEPATWALVAAGLAGVAGAARRRQRSR